MLQWPLDPTRSLRGVSGSRSCPQFSKYSLETDVAAQIAIGEEGQWAQRSNPGRQEVMFCGGRVTEHIIEQLNLTPAELLCGGGGGLEGGPPQITYIPRYLWCSRDRRPLSVL